MLRVRGILTGVACVAYVLIVAGISIPADGQTVDRTKLSIGGISVNRVLFLGNSITLHGPLESIGWTGNWGMAASEESRDYVHLLSAKIAGEAHGEPKTLVRNIADFERQYATFDVESSLAEALSFQADLIILAIGENVSVPTTEKEQAEFQKAVTHLLKALKGHGGPKIFVRSTFWSDEMKNTAMAEACRATDCVFVDLGKLDAEESNFARSERTIEHAGVAAHPGDRGMQAIADGLWKALQKVSAEQR